MNNGLFSSKSDDWATPQHFFDSVAASYGPFDLDACASAENNKCARFYAKDDDALSREWRGRVWMNPPYGRMISKWVRKAHESARAGATVVCLLPARTDTAWWHDYVLAGEVRFLRGRLRFGDASDSAPFPSALVVFRPRLETRRAKR